jgi:hypothetical protein
MEKEEDSIGTTEMKGVMPVFPDWETELMTRKDPRAEALEWLLERGFTLSLQGFQNIMVWVRALGSWQARSPEDTASPEWARAVKLRISEHEAEWSVWLEVHPGNPLIDESSHLGASGGTPKEAIEKLAEQIPLAEIIRKAVGDEK